MRTCWVQSWPGAGARVGVRAAQISSNIAVARRMESIAPQYRSRARREKIEKGRVRDLRPLAPSATRTRTEPQVEFAGVYSPALSPAQNLYRPGTKRGWQSARY